MMKRTEDAILAVHDKRQTSRMTCEATILEKIGNEDEDVTLATVTKLQSRGIGEAEVKKNRILKVVWD
ncbi:hypothetical protein WN48_01891 [Eufriesea mexicana]|nr:hypothetical protein WN48_01891 [Eufriesea mexicana]